MDLELSGKKVAVIGRGALATRTADLFVAEGACVSNEASSSCDALVVIAPRTPNQTLESNEDSVNFAEWQHVVDLVEASRIATAGMAQRGYGRVVWVGPVEAKFAGGDPAADLVSVAGLGALGLMKAMAGELGPEKVNCNSVLWDGADFESTAAAVLFLASGTASYLTGTVLSVDGGAGGSTF